MNTTNKSKLAIQYIEGVPGVIAAFVTDETKFCLHLGVAVIHGDPRLIKREIKLRASCFRLNGVEYHMEFFTQVGETHTLE